MRIAGQRPAFLRTTFGTPRSAHACTAREAERAGARRAAIAAVVVVAALVYANATANRFALDDNGIILRNPLVQGGGAGWWRAFTSPYWPAAISPGGQYRPLGILSFALDWAVSGGSPVWFHLVNIAWHVAASVLVWWLAAELLAPLGALAAGLLFAVHPVHVEAVANVVGRLELMAAVFVLAALAAHRRGRWVAAPLFALALLCKENAVVFLALAPAHDLLVAGPPRAAVRARRGLYIAYGITALAYALTLALVFRGGGFGAAADTFRQGGTGERLLTVLALMAQDMRLLVAPFQLSADYEPQVTQLTRTLTPAVVLGVAIALAWAAAIARSWRRAPVLAFALLWVPVALSPVSNVLFASGVTLAERTFYLPSVGMVLAAGWVVARASPVRPRLVLAAIAAVLVAFAARTWTRTPSWRDNQAYVVTLLRDHPESYRGRVAAARVFAGMGDTAAVARQYARAVELFPDWRVYRDYAERLIEAGRFAQAAALLDSASARAPREPGTVLRRAEVRAALGEWPAALRLAQRALALAPDSLRALRVLDAAAQQLGAPAPALRAYRAALARHPDDWQVRAGLADLLLALGDTAAAATHARAAVRLSGGNPRAVALRDRAASSRP